MDMFGPRLGSLDALWLDSCKRTTFRSLAGGLTVFFNRSKFLAIAN